MATWPSTAYAMGQLSVFHPLQFSWRFMAPATVAAIVPLATWLAPALRAPRRAAALIPLVTAGFIYDAWPAFGGPSWVDWNASSNVFRHARAVPAPTCEADSKRSGFAGSALDWQQLVDARKPHLAAPEIAPHPKGVSEGPRRPSLSGPDWVGRASGDLPTRVVGLLLPPNDLEPSLALVHMVPSEFFTPTTRTLYRNGIRSRDIEAMESAGVALLFPKSPKLPPRRLDPWPRVWLQTKSGERYGLQAEVTRSKPSRLTLALPEGHPGGTLVVIEQAFAGWTVRVDEREAKAHSIEGLLAVDVAAGASRVDWRYGSDTPARRGGLVLSTATVLILVWRRRSRP
jgi:hypothetical protein